MSAPRFVRFADVRPELLHWLWPAYIPRGKLTLLDGDPGLGKSLITIDLAARLSTGHPMPDGSGGGRVGRTLLLTAEDGAADTTLGRLAAAGADLSQVFVPDRKGAARFGLPRHLKALEQFVVREHLDLVAFDPVVAFLPPGVNLLNDQSVRTVLDELAAMAERTGAAVQMVRHLNKTTGQKALYRGGGSIGIIGAARAGLVVTGDPAAGGARVLAATKENLCAMPPALGYRVVPADTGAPRIEWTGPVGLTADEALRPPRAEAAETPPVGVIPAVEWLMEFLRAGPRPAVDVYEAAVAAGISERTLERAKGPAGVESRLVTDPATGRQRWKWRLFETPSYLPPLPFEEVEEEGW
jgi:hypothetical protein